MWLMKCGENYEIFEYTPAPKQKDQMEGFIYLIQQKSTGMKYIGKKSFWASKQRQKDGKIKKFRVESNWADYFGSSPRLQEEVREKGEDDFTRTIIHLCKSKSEMNYLETHEIFTSGALLSDEYFNDWVSCKITKAHLRTSREAIRDHLINSGVSLHKGPSLAD